MPITEVTLAKLNSLVARGLITIEQKRQASTDEQLEELVMYGENLQSSIIETNLNELIKGGLISPLQKQSIPDEKLINFASEEVFTLLIENRISIERAIEFSEQDLLRLYFKIDCILADHISIDYVLGLSTTVFDSTPCVLLSPTINPYKIKREFDEPEAISVDKFSKFYASEPSEVEEENNSPIIISQRPHLKLQPKRLELSPSDLSQTEDSTFSMNSNGVQSLLRFCSPSAASGTDFSPSSVMTPSIRR